MTLSPLEFERYQRQIALSEVGVIGQEKLLRASVLVVGAGGLGCPVLQYLVGAGVGRIGICDFDLVERSNLHRQVLYGERALGHPKARAAAERLHDLNSHCELTAFVEQFSVKNALAMVSNFDIVVDGSDNFITRYLLNDACVKEDKPFVAASILGFSGQIGIYNALKSDGERTATYRCVFPEPPSPGRAPRCVEVGVLGVLPGIVGTFQASEVLKYILGLDTPHSGIMLVEVTSMSIRKVNALRNEAEIANIKERPLSEESKARCLTKGASNTMKEITVQELKAKIDAKEDIQIIDVREPSEKAEFPDIGGELIPLAQVRSEVTKISKEKQVVIYCRSGGRSGRACEALEKEFGFTNLWNLKGGIMAWAQLVEK